MRLFAFLPILITVIPAVSIAQTTTARDSNALTALIEQYSLARENRDTVMLKDILTNDVDQLVSTGEWRKGIRAAVQGMQASSANAPGKRTLTVDKVRLLSRDVALVDCRYDIEDGNGNMRRMWSSFTAVSHKGKWRISAIRNMLPTRNN